MKRRKVKTNETIKEIKSLMESLKKEDNIRFVFSYIEIGNTLNELRSDVVMNIGEDLASSALKLVIDDKVFENPIDIIKKGGLEELEEITKLHMFNLFNGKNKPEA